MGCDAKQIAKTFSVKFQSTHPHGVRLPRPLFNSLIWSFNPRTRMGCDQRPVSNDGNGEFQSTHPHGVRQSCRRFNCAGRHASFNPRTRMGCDVELPGVNLAQIVSIHAPAWGATSRRYGSTAVDWFQSTHPHGVRLATSMVSDIR